MLAKPPGKRHSSWKALIADLDRVLNGGMPTVVSPPAGQSVLVHRRPADAPRTRVASPRKSVVLGKSTVRKLHERDKARLKPARPSPKARSKIPAIAAVATVLLAIGIVTGIAVSRSRKKKAPETGPFVVVPTVGAPPENATAQEESPPKAPSGSIDPGLGEVREEFEAAMTYSHKSKGDLIGRYWRFRKLSSTARGNAVRARRRG